MCRLRLRLKSGELVILHTDKSGKFAVMTMKTSYIVAGDVHLEGEEEITMEDLKKNQRQMNGHVSMLLKMFNTGGDWKHQARMRESMISDGHAVCPMWLLFECHKGWSW